MTELSKLECDQFAQNPSFNPKNNKKIKINGPSYKKIKKQCEDFLNKRTKKDIDKEIHIVKEQMKALQRVINDLEKEKTTFDDQERHTKQYTYRTEILIHSNDYPDDTPLHTLLPFRRQLIPKINYILENEEFITATDISDGKLPLKSVQMEVGKDGYLYIQVESHKTLSRKDIDKIKENINGQIRREEGHEIDDIDDMIIYISGNVQ